MRFEVEANGHRHRIDARRGPDGWLVSLDGRPLSADLARVGDRWSLLISDGPPEGGPYDSSVGAGFSRPSRTNAWRSYDVAIESRGRRERVVHVDGRAVHVSLAGPRTFTDGRHREGAAGSGPLQIASPMAGRVVTLLVRAGDSIAAGQGLVIVEAMKMENELRAPRAGTVTGVPVAAGTSIDAGTVLVVIE